MHVRILRLSSSFLFFVSRWLVVCPASQREWLRDTLRSCGTRSPANSFTPQGGLNLFLSGIFYFFLYYFWGEFFFRLRFLVSNIGRRSLLARSLTNNVIIMHAIKVTIGKLTSG